MSLKSQSDIEYQSPSLQLLINFSIFTIFPDFLKYLFNLIFNNWNLNHADLEYVDSVKEKFVTDVLTVFEWICTPIGRHQEWRQRKTTTKGQERPRKFSSMRHFIKDCKVNLVIYHVQIQDTDGVDVLLQSSSTPSPVVTGGWRTSIIGNLKIA